jgi:chemotaxis family two-component system sensor kinase Cph1
MLSPTDSAPPPWADGAYSIKRHGVTLTNCDSEPVQQPGCSQAHGVVLVLRVSDLTILQVSENSAEHLGLRPDELLGTSIVTVVEEAGAQLLRTCLETEPLERNPRQSLDAGFDHHLVKPVNLAILMELLASLHIRQH